MSSDERAPAVRAAGGVAPRMSVLHDGASASASVTSESATPGAAAGAWRACTLTLVALLAWLITPPAAVLLLSTIGLVGVVRAHRAGKVDGHCTLGRPKLIVAYLSAAWALGAWFTIAEVGALMA